MTYQAQWLLTHDDAFVSRCRACITAQADVHINDTGADVVALSRSVLTSANGGQMVTFQNMLGAVAGFADAADNDDGTVDSTKVTDAEILSSVDILYPEIATLYYAPDGTALP